MNRVRETERIRQGSGYGFVQNVRNNRYAYLLIMPALLCVIMFSYVPLFGIVLAFKDYDVTKGLFASPSVGLDNFIKIFTYPNMLHAIWNSFLNGIVLIFGTFPFPIILALMLNELRCLKFKKIVQTISYMPHFLSWISIVGMFYSFFAVEGSYNQLMAKLFGEGYEAKNILMDSKYFLTILFTTSIWKNVGWSSVVFLAAIVGIDPTLYEAATVDGCGKFKQVFYITLPGIASTTIILLIMSLGSLFRTSFEQIYGFQNVYTQEDTEVINTLIYRQGIENGKYSLATAFGLTEGIVSISLLLIANASTKKLFKISIW